VSELGVFRARCGACGADVTFVAAQSLNAGRGRVLVDLVLAGGDPSSAACPECGALVLSDDPWFCCDFSQSAFLACVPRLFADPSHFGSAAVREQLDPLVVHLRLVVGDAALTLTPDSAATREKLLARAAGIDWAALETWKARHGDTPAHGAVRLVAVEAGTCAFEVYGPGGRHAGIVAERGAPLDDVQGTVPDPGVVHEVGPGVEIVDAAWAASVAGS
jgi:hypothetical protein